MNLKIKIVEINIVDKRDITINKADNEINVRIIRKQS